MVEAETTSFDDQLLAELLVSARLITPDQLAEAQARHASFSTDGAILVPKAFVPDPVAIVLRALDPADLAEVGQIALGEPLGDPGEWPTWSNGQFLVLNPSEPGITEAIAVAPGAALGLFPTPQGTFLVDSKPQSIPADWMIGRVSPPARVDVLAEKIEGVQGFGTIQVVPVSSSLTTEFEFLLPLGVIHATEDGQLSYRLRVQKQPGTRAVPMTIRIRLPEGAQITQTPPGATVDETGILIQTDLRLDLQIEILYRIP